MNKSNHLDPNDGESGLWYAPLTGPGRAAIAVIEIRGTSAEPALGKLFRPATDRPWKTGQIRYGLWQGTAAAASAESVVVLPVARERFEIHCHGGSAAISRIMADLDAAGGSRRPSFQDFETPAPVDPSQLAVRDRTAGRFRDEAAEVLSQCMTVHTAAIALDQVRGALVRWRNQAIEKLTADRRHAAEIASQASEIANRGRIGSRLARPWDVVLAGPPNVGKSSLINALVGYERSITMDLAGTTRDVLDAETVIDGWPLRLRDTAGMHPAAESVEKQGIERALDAIEAADLIIQVSQPGIHLDQRLFELAKRRVGTKESDAPKLGAENPDAAAINGLPPCLLVINKSDLADRAEIEIPDAAFTEVVHTIAVDGQGIAELADAILRSLSLEIPEPGSPVPVSPRQLDWITEVASSAGDGAAMLRLLERG